MVPGPVFPLSQWHHWTRPKPVSIRQLVWYHETQTRRPPLSSNSYDLATRFIGKQTPWECVSRSLTRNTPQKSSPQCWPPFASGHDRLRPCILCTLPYTPELPPTTHVVWKIVETVLRSSSRMRDEPSHPNGETAS